LGRLEREGAFFDHVFAPEPERSSLRIALQYMSHIERKGRLTERLLNGWQDIYSRKVRTIIRNRLPMSSLVKIEDFFWRTEPLAIDRFSEKGYYPQALQAALDHSGHYYVSEGPFIE
jgi:hypothetical protein